MSDDLAEKMKNAALLNADGTPVDDADAMLLLVADEITRLRAQVAAAYVDAADTCIYISEDRYAPMVRTSDEAFKAACLHMADVLRVNRMPRDAAAALDALLERAVKAALEKAAECAKADLGAHDELIGELLYINPAAIVQKVKA